MSRPEQVQADLLVIALYLGHRAWREGRPGPKHWWWAASAAVFALCLLVKPNALPFAAVLAAGLLGDRRALRRERLLNVGLVAGVVSAVIGLFIVFHHRPATGTWYFNASRSVYWLWNFRTDHDRMIAPENGPASRAFYALVRVLPERPRYCCEDIFTHVAWVPEEDRRPFRKRYLALLGSLEPALVDQLYREAKASERPAGDLLSLYYYLGLLEADRLLERVYLETLRAHPRLFLEILARNVVSGFLVHYTPVVPLINDPTVLDLRPAAGTVAPARFGFVRVRDDAPTSRLIGYKHRAYLWLPGVSIVEALIAVFSVVPRWLPWALIVAGVALTLTAPAAPSEASRCGPTVLLAGILLFFVASGVIIDARPKELRLIQPPLDLLTAVGAAALARTALARVALRLWRAVRG